jgi:hypothetical protein
MDVANLASLQTTSRKDEEAPMKKLASRESQIRLTEVVIFSLDLKVVARDSHHPAIALVDETIKTKSKLPHHSCHHLRFTAQMTMALTKLSKFPSW